VGEASAGEAGEGVDGSVEAVVEVPGEEDGFFSTGEEVGWGAGCGESGVGEELYGEGVPVDLAVD